MMKTITQTPIQLSDVPPSDPMETVRKGLRLFSKKVGILTDVASGMHFSGDPVCYSLGNKGCQALRLGHTSGKVRDKSGGAALSLEIALAASIGEMVERYCMRFYDTSEMIFGSYNDLRHDYNVVHPARTRLHSQEQIAAKGGSKSSGGVGRLEVHDESAKVCWEWGYSLTTNEWKLIPAYLVYLPYQAAPNEARTGWNCSTGLAAGNTIEEAILGGICEWIERDAFVISWLNRFIPRRVIIDDPDVLRLVEQNFHYGHPRVELEVFDVTLDIPVPSIFVRTVRPMEFGPGVFVGAATRLSSKGAVIKSLIELAQCVAGCRYKYQERHDWQPNEDFSNITGFEEHSILYLKRPDIVPEAFSFCRDIPRTVKLSEMPDRSTGNVLADINTCIDILHQAGHEVIVTDLTTPDIREAGFHAVRVTVPGLQNLHANHNWPCLGVDRIYEVPRRLEWERHGWRADAGLNPFPHPFP